MCMSNLIFVYCTCVITVYIRHKPYLHAPLYHVCMHITKLIYAVSTICAAMLYLTCVHVSQSSSICCKYTTCTYITMLYTVSVPCAHIYHNVHLCCIYHEHYVVHDCFRVAWCKWHSCGFLLKLLLWWMKMVLFDVMGKCDDDVEMSEPSSRFPLNKLSQCALAYNMERPRASFRYPYQTKLFFITSLNFDLNCCKYCTLDVLFSGSIWY